MKKLLVLVLGLASLANAQIWTGAYDDVTKIVNVSITNSAGRMYIGLAITDGDGTLSPFSMGAQAPVSSAMFATLGAGMDYEGYGEGELWCIIDVRPTPVYTDGEWLKATFSGSMPSTITMYSFNEMTEVFTIEGLMLIPEPITMSLLSLGGLMLRRRK